MHNPSINLMVIDDEKRARQKIVRRLKSRKSDLDVCIHEPSSFQDIQAYFHGGEDAPEVAIVDVDLDNWREDNRSSSVEENQTGPVKINGELIWDGFMLTEAMGKSFSDCLFIVYSTHVKAPLFEKSRSELQLKLKNIEFVNPRFEDGESVIEDLVTKHLDKLQARRDETYSYPAQKYKTINMHIAAHHSFSKSAAMDWKVSYYFLEKVLRVIDLNKKYGLDALEHDGFWRSTDFSWDIYYDKNDDSIREIMDTTTKQLNQCLIYDSGHGVEISWKINGAVATEKSLFLATCSKLADINELYDRAQNLKNGKNWQNLLRIFAAKELARLYLLDRLTLEELHSFFSLQKREGSQISLQVDLLNSLGSEKYLIERLKFQNQGLTFIKNRFRCTIEDIDMAKSTSWVKMTDPLEGKKSIKLLFKLDLLAKNQIISHNNKRVKDYLDATFEYFILMEPHELEDGSLDYRSRGYFQPIDVYSDYLLKKMADPK